MSEEVTPTNGNGRSAWLKQVPLWGALVAAVGAALFAGRVSTKVDTLGDQVTALQAAAANTALEARVRANTESIGRLTADYAGHLDKAGLQWSMLQADIAAIKSAINDLRRQK